MSTRQQRLKEIEKVLKKFIYPTELSDFPTNKYPKKFFTTALRGENFCISLFIQLDKKGSWTVISEKFESGNFLRLDLDSLENSSDLVHVLTGLLGLGLLTTEHIDVYYSWQEYQTYVSNFLEDFQTTIAFLDEFEIEVDKLGDDGYIDKIQNRFLREFKKRWREGAEF